MIAEEGLSLAKESMKAGLIKEERSIGVESIIVRLARAGLEMAEGSVVMGLWKELR